VNTVDKKLIEAMTARLAARDVPDTAVLAVAKALAQMKQAAEPIDVDLCTIGICTDHVFHDQGDLLEFIKQVGSGQGIGSVRIFPQGIVAPNHFLVKIEHLARR